MNVFERADIAAEPVFMAFLTGAMADLVADYPSVFTLKISNACFPL